MPCVRVRRWLRSMSGEQRNTQGLQLEKAEVDKIKSIVSEHAHILDYDSKELESPDVFDGVMNFLI